MDRVLKPRKPRLCAPKEEWDAYWALSLQILEGQAQERRDRLADQAARAEVLRAKRLGITVEQLREEHKIVDEIERDRLEKQKPSL